MSKISKYGIFTLDMVLEVLGNLITNAESFDHTLLPIDRVKTHIKHLKRVKEEITE